MLLSKIVKMMLAESEASDQAHKMGLHYKGRGYWMDKTGKSVAQTVDGQLVKLEEKPSADPQINNSHTEQPKNDNEIPSDTDSLYKALTEPTAEDYMYKKIGGNGSGSTVGGGIYEGTDGVKRYVKPYQDPSRSSCEKLACCIYRELGIGAPEAVTFGLNGKTAFASTIVNGELLSDHGLDQDVANKILDGFAADVLCANWDAIGLMNDNIIVNNGIPYRIDNGGSFLFRAMETSGRKPENVLDEIPEIEIFPTKNASYSAVFKAAGYKDSAQLASRFKKQVVDIYNLYKDNGSWLKYVHTACPEMNINDKKEVIAMLNNRMKKLIEYADSLE